MIVRFILFVFKVVIVLLLTFVCFFVFAVVGESLKKVLSSGVKGEMDKAMQLLAKKSVAVRVLGGRGIQG